ncbi:MAG: hypothetical protein R3B09_34870 [Nannocystaceae bacterium]
MSRYVRIDTQLRDLAEVDAALRSLGATPTLADEPAGLMLQGSLECAGEPVDLRLEAGAFGSVEDLGLRREASGELVLICGEPDREHLAVHLLAPLRVAIARARAERAAEREGLAVDAVADEHGVVRLHLRRR